MNDKIKERSKARLKNNRIANTTESDKGNRKKQHTKGDSKMRFSKMFQRDSGQERKEEMETKVTRFNPIRSLKTRIGMLAAVAVIGAVSIAAIGSQAGTASAHSGSFWAGYHYTQNGICREFGSRPPLGFPAYSQAEIQPPVVYATRNDARTTQRVAWRARLVQYDSYNQRWLTVAYGTWQYATASDSAPASFSSYTFPSITRGTANYAQVDFAFYSTTTGNLVEQSSHWVGGFLTAHGFETYCWGW